MDFQRRPQTAKTPRKPESGRLGRIASGNHLTADNDEPEPAPFTEAQLIEGDRARNVDKAEVAAQANDEQALRLQLARQDTLTQALLGAP